ncbi:MAG: SpoIVB peptidase [Christensenellales bacterium]
MSAKPARRLVTVAVAILFLAGATATAQAKTLLPGGQSIGVAVETEGLVVIGASDVGSMPSPARLAGLRPGDIITGVDGKAIAGVDELLTLLGERSVKLTYLRDGEARSVTLTPARDATDGRFKLGVWVRDSTAGIGTLTFYDPETGRYGALGHAVTDADAGIVLPVKGGAIYENSIIDVKRGEEGAPGEILGEFYDGGYLGTIDGNTHFGIFGSAKERIENALYPRGIETAAPDQVRVGRAKILATVGDDGLTEYECEIVRIEDQAKPTTRSFTIRVTDERLLTRTGGIVQGMSGSPVIQNGKLVGAVTHVYVNDPTMGYGVYIDWMLDDLAA